MSLSIRTRLFGLVGLAALSIGGFAGYVYGNTDEHVEDSDFRPVNEVNVLLADELPPPAYAIEAFLVCHRLEDTTDPAARAALIEEFGKREAEFHSRIAYWSEHLPDGPLRAQITGPMAESGDAFFGAVHGKFLPAIESNDLTAASTITSSTLTPLFLDHREAVMRAVEVTNLELAARISTVERQIGTTKTEFAVLGAFLASLGLAIGYWITRDLSSRLTAADHTLRSVADGDYRVRMEEGADDELGQMARSLNRAVGAVEQAIADVRGIAEGLADSARRLSSSAEEISAGAQSQASALEETAANLEEITATIQASSSRAGGARQLAVASRDVAVQGGKVVEDAVSAMTAINQSSTRIAAIIGTIDEIAFQTNLLALNAAVEAARAGEQGRGFAVVAAEVRNLAQRSATAARETKELIQDSQRKVGDGTQLVNRSGDILREIVTSAKGVAETVDEMAGAFRDQSTGVNEVHKAVSQMDTVTQTNSAATTDLSDMSAGLAAQATQLSHAMSRFHVGVAANVAPVAVSTALHTPKVAMMKRTRPGSKPRPSPSAGAPASKGPSDFPSDAEMFDTL